MDKRLEDSRKKGDIAEKLFELECIKRGIEIYKPVSSGTRVDYLICLDNDYKKVQIKYVSSYNDKISVSFVKNQNGRKDINGKPLYKKYNTNEIDLFFVYCPDTATWYDIPIELSSSCRGVSLNINTTAKKNNQTKGVKYAADYIWK